MLTAGQIRQLVSSMADDAAVPLYVKYNRVDNRYIFVRIDDASTIKPQGALCDETDPQGIFLTLSLVGAEEIEPEACDECGAAYPEDADDLLGDFHAESCSLHPKNVV
jgi:hypothetical protein